MKRRENKKEKSEGEKHENEEKLITELKWENSPSINHQSNSTDPSPLPTRKNRPLNRTNFMNEKQIKKIVKKEIFS